MTRRDLKYIITIGVEWPTIVWKEVHIMSSNKSIPTYKRQRLLLSVAQRLVEPAYATDFQKIMFLCMMQTGRNDYEFVPYRFGPYSFQLATDIETLRRSGFLSDETHRIKIDHPISDLAGDFYSGFTIPNERGDDLMRKTYRAYPYYTINSEIIRRLFKNSPTEMNQLLLERERLKQENNVLFTIGYEGRSLESFLNTLLQNDVRVLCDVRKNPYSRKYGFSRDKLEQVTQGTAIKYVAFPELGIESEKRKSLDTADDYKDLFSEYKETLSYRKKELERLYNIYKAEGRVALMCFEKDPQMCHRHIIRDYLCSEYLIWSSDL